MKNFLIVIPVYNDWDNLNKLLKKINIIAEDINYKDLLFDKFELESNHLKLNFKLKSKEIYFQDDPKIKFKISLSQNSLRKILLSNKR